MKKTARWFDTYSVWCRLAFGRNFLKIRIFALYFWNVSNFHSEWFIVSVIVQLVVTAIVILLDFIIFTKLWSRWDHRFFLKPWSRLPCKHVCFWSFLALLRLFYVGFTSWLMAARMALRKIVLWGMLINLKTVPSHEVSVLSPFYAFFRLILFTSILYISFVQVLIAHLLQWMFLVAKKRKEMNIVR